MTRHSPFPTGAPLRGPPGFLELLFLDRNSAFADIDLDAGGLLTLLVEQITKDAGRDDERSDDEIGTLRFMVVLLQYRSQ